MYHNNKDLVVAVEDNRKIEADRVYLIEADSIGLQHYKAQEQA